MTTLHAPDMYVIVGDEYAKRLGYEELVGGMAVIDNVMKALCGVTMLSGKPEMIGKQVDIHIQDCILHAYPGMSDYSAVINTNTGKIYYSQNRDLVDYVRECLHPDPVRMFHEIRYMHDVLDFCYEQFATTTRVKGYDWLMFCLDDRESEHTRGFLETYEAEMASKEAEQEAFKTLSKSSKVLGLAEQLQKQLEGNSLQKQVDELFAKHKTEGRPFIEEGEESNGDYGDDDDFGGFDPHSYY